ncbi:A24 family peptidase [Streptomyces sp.]|uniref:prepilin peptidase n=1 Tax=Streptomyces sp. TaxID=1931 RepID=UPI002811AF78|nr:A24 family peptidase [Streptomyces sp.]
MLGTAPLWSVLTAGLIGAVVGWFLPRVVLRYSPVTDEPAFAPSRPLLVVATAALFVLVASFFGLSWQLPAYLFFAAIAVVLTVIDLRHHLLPNAVVLPALGIGFVLLALAATGESAWGALLRAVLGALALFVLYLVLALISPAGLGMGDVKLAAVLGLFLGFQGWGTLFVGAVLASVAGMVVGLVVLASRRGGLRNDVPFGPSMLAGALVAVIWGELLAREYLLPGLY